MTSKELENLAKTGKLKIEPGDRQEFDGLLRSAHARLADAKIESLSIESRFDLACNASHALALAALRWHGYRSENRYLVFQALQHTAGLGPELWRVLSLCHDRRNRTGETGQHGNHGLARQADRAHDPVHQEGGTGQVAGVLQQDDEHEQDKDLRKENDHAADARNPCRDRCHQYRGR